MVGRAALSLGLRDFQQRNNYMARRARKGNKKGSGLQPLFIGIGAVVVAAVVFGSGLMKKGGAVRGNEPTPNFRIADYRRDGSRFVATGNSYVFDGRVENIETIGNDLMLSVSIPDNPDERLPLLVPHSVHLKVNLTRGDRFLFEASCRTGRTESGEEVKGVLIVKNAETK